MRNRRFIFLGGLLAGIFFLLGLLGSSQLPKLRSWMLVKIEKESRDNLPIRVLPTSLELNFFPLGVTLSGVRIFPKEETAKYFDPLIIEKLQVSVSPWQLIQGRLRLNEVDVDGTSVSVRVPPVPHSDGKPLEGLFAQLQLIPISRISLNDVSVKIEISEPHLKLQVDNASLSVEKRKNFLSMSVDSLPIHAFDPETKANVLLDFEAEAAMTPERVVVESLKIRRGDSFFIASGSADGDTEGLVFKDGDGSMRGEMKLDSMRDWAIKTFPRLTKVPALKGRAFFETKVTRKNGAHPTATFQAKAMDLSIDKIHAGNVATSGEFKNDVVHLPQLTIENRAGSASLNEILVKNVTSNEPTFEATLKTRGIQGNDLLPELGIKRLPIFAKISGEVPCTGQVKPQFLLSCAGQLKGEELHLRDDMDPKSFEIVAIAEFTAQGSFTVDKTRVTYTTELSMPDSKGRSQGTVIYDEGFKINFEGDRFAMKDLTSLANLKLEGVTRVKGFTSGDSSAATVTMNLDGTDMWFEDYWIGHPKAQIAYKAGNLTFSNLQGYYTVSRYSGDINLNIPKKEISVVGRLPFFDMHDMLKAFSRKVKLPFPVTGTGQAQMRVSGPLDFPHLSYDIKSSLFRGSVSGETFDQAHFDVKSVGGEVKTERVQLSKGNALITLTGQAHPSGQIETNVRGRGIHLEDTTSVAGFGLALSGQVDFDMDMNGYVLAPDTDLRGHLTKTSIGDQSVADSNFQLKFGRKAIEGKGQFMGDIAQGELIYPFDPDAPFKLKLKTQDWNFAPIFAAIAGPGSRKDYEGRMTADVDLASTTGGFWNATGTAKIGNFSLSRGALALKSQGPIEISMKDGFVKTQNLSLAGEGIFLKALDHVDPVAKLDLQVTAKLDLGLFALLTPFFEDLRGLLSLSVNLRGGDRPAEILGSAYLEKGYLKFFDFPHPFEDISADVLFNQNKILFNSIKSEFGGGIVSATGGMELKGHHDIPLSVSGSFDKITMNVPEKMKTTGSGKFTFSGNWFPFLLKGNYDISDGLMTKEFGGEQATGDTVGRDLYLPDFLVEQDFTPLLIDLDVNFQRGVAVKNELVEGKAMGQITAKGQPKKPSLSGTITTDKETKINFRDTTFEVVSANIQFNEGTEINPKLFITARSRIDPYDVNLLVQGTGQKPEFQLSSVPPLAEKDIVSLLAFGATDTALDKKITSDQQAASTGFNATTGLIKKNPISDIIKDKLGFDVQFSTAFDESNVSVQKIVATRQFNPKVGVTASRSLGKSPETEAKVQYRLTDRVFLIGSWLGKDYSEATDNLSTADKNPNKVGLDVEYKVQFK